MNTTTMTGRRDKRQTEQRRAARMAARASIFAVVCTTLLVGPVHAGRPMATEDAATLPDGECEVESFVGRARAPGEPRLSMASVQIGCGVGSRNQVALAISGSRLDGLSAQAVAVLGKTRLTAPVEQGTNYSLAWGVSAQRQSGQTLKHEASYLTAVMSMDLSDDLIWHANVGWTNSKSESMSTTVWATGLEYATSPTLDLTAEIYGNDRENQPWLQVGARWAVVADKFLLDTSYGMQTGAVKARLFTVGLHYFF